MNALRFSEFGPPSVLRVEEIAIPKPGEGEALVRVKAAAINPSDIGNVAGHFKHTTLPRTPGRDFAGAVVNGKQLEGEPVWGSGPNLGIVRDGSHAEYVVVPVETLSPKPKSLTMAEAAAIGVPFITAWASVVSAARIQPGETILIVGAAGAVGQAATQIADWKQARVIVDLARQVHGHATPCGEEQNERVTAPVRCHESTGCAKSREYQSFRKKLLQQPAASRAQRRPHGKFFAPRRRPRQQQVRQIHAHNQQNRSHRAP